MSFRDQSEDWSWESVFPAAHKSRAALKVPQRCGLPRHPFGVPRNDLMFLRNQFARDGTFGMPIIKKTKLNLDNLELIGYDKLNEKIRTK